MTVPIEEKLRKDPAFAVGLLLFMLGTHYEETLFDDGRAILEDMGKLYHKKGYLTDNQISCAVKKLRPYIVSPDELLDIAPEGIYDPERGCVCKNGPISTHADSGPEKQQENNLLRAELIGNRLSITFPYDPDMVGRVKAVPGRVWISTVRAWQAPISEEAIALLRGWGFWIDPEADKWKDDRTAPVIIDNKDFEIPGFNCTLRPYQLEGVQILDKWGGRALLGDDMGLGKTPQAIGYLQLHPEDRPAVIACPATLKYHWADKIDEWMTFGKVVNIIDGRYNPEAGPLPEADIHIINYDILDITKKCHNCKGTKKVDGNKCRVCSGTGTVTKCRPDLLGITPAIYIADESHYCKSPETQRTRAHLHLAAVCPKVIELTGTPADDKIADLFTQIKAVKPDLFPNFFRFGKRYCGAEHNGFGWSFTGASNTKELHDILRASVMIRRKKADVLPELPEKVKAVIPFELSNRREYDRALVDFVGWVRDNKGKEAADTAGRAEALARMETLKQLILKGKLDQCIRWVEDFLECGEKLVLFADHRYVIDKVMKHFGDIAVKVVGGMKPKDRHEAVKAFQEDDAIRLFVGSKAAKEGVTLTEASNVAFLELWWNPSFHSQAGDRVLRIGQESDSVTEWYLLGRDTVEEGIAAMVDAKAQNLSKALDGKDVERWDLLGELLKNMEGL